MDENNQYSNAMTQSLCEFNLLIQEILEKDKIGNLFIVAIKLHEKNANEKTILFNETFNSIFEKEKVIIPTERSVFQLMNAIRLNDKGLLNSYKFASKNHSAMSKKYSIRLYAQYIHFLMQLVGKKNLCTSYFRTD